MLSDLYLDSGNSTMITCKYAVMKGRLAEKYHCLPSSSPFQQKKGDTADQEKTRLNPELRAQYKAGENAPHHRYVQDTRR